MKILFAVFNVENSRNPYTRTIIEGLKELDSFIQIDSGINEFWSEKADEYEVVHINWPDQLLVAGKNCKLLRSKILSMKSKGVKIVSTCHNLESHSSGTDELSLAYEIVYSLSDVIFHLGNYSLELFKHKYYKSNNVLIYHHIYDKIFNIHYSKAEASKSLSIDLNKRYIICFGMFRNKYERELIINLSKSLSKVKDVEILAPSFSPIFFSRNIFKTFFEIVRFTLYSIKYPKIKKNFRFVKDDLLPLYFAVADVLVIQRLKILNSGNLPLGFYFKKVVVGPNMGNVGSILEETENPTFDPQCLDDFLKAVYTGLSLGPKKGQENYYYAVSNFETDVIVKKIYDTYLELLN